MRRILLLVMVALPQALFGDATWYWAQAYPTHHDWSLLKGVATVSVDTTQGGQFAAELYEVDSDTKKPGLLCITVTGEIRGDKILATIVTHNTDLPPEQIEGRRETYLGRSDSGAAVGHGEVITFADRGYFLCLHSFTFFR